ncbi:hypothetical protein DB31_7032 [Hyalangium minutum]|uniref:Uncharacterized protein n=1 Tax=Hyalangium minutum TaxID=394096 RepID=A0A085WN67_9BACT|nr:hypothetical protein DB31_7032 [Hyalangium minutum]
MRNKPNAKVIDIHSTTLGGEADFSSLFLGRDLEPSCWILVSRDARG